MFCKLFVLAVCVAVAAAQADKYPAGVHPAACPNYPYCDNTVVALSRGAAVVAPLGIAREYPAGVHPAACPNYPYCHSYGLPYFYNAIAPGIAREYPAGVNPATCPNYPYCH